MTWQRVSSFSGFDFFFWFINVGSYCIDMNRIIIMYLYLHEEMIDTSE